MTCSDSHRDVTLLLLTLFLDRLLSQLVSQSTSVLITNKRQRFFRQQQLAPLTPAHNQDIHHHESEPVVRAAAIARAELRRKAAIKTGRHE